MAALAKILVTILFVTILLWLSLANRAPADFSIPPFFEDLIIPPALVLLGGMVMGFLWGGAIVWLNGASGRSENRHLRREIKMLEQEISKKETV